MGNFRYYKCKKCGCKVVATYLARHWLNKHFELMYIILEVGSQSIFSLDIETKTVYQIDNKETQASSPVDEYKYV